MSASLPHPAVLSDSTASAGKSLGEVLEGLSTVKPHSFDFPAAVVLLRACGDGAIAGLGDGKVVLVTVSPTPVSYLLDCEKPHTGQVFALAVSQDCEMAISGDGNGEVKLWSVVERREIATLEGHQNNIYTVAISQDNKLALSGGADTTVKVWDLKSRSAIATLEGHSSYVKRLIVTSDSKFCISGENLGVIKVWDLEAKKDIATFEGHTKEVSYITLSPDEKTLWSGSKDNDIRVWSLDSFTELMVFKGHTNFISGLKLIREGQVCISTSADRTGKLWSLPERREIGALEGHTSIITCMEVSKNERICLTCTQNKAVKLWDLESCTEVISFVGHSDVIWAITMTADNKHFLTGSKDRTIKIWSLNPRCEEKILSFPERIESIAVTADYLILATRKDIRLWSIAENQELAVMQGHTEEINEFAITPNQKFLLSSSDDKSVKLWDLATRKEIHTFTGHSKLTYRLAVTPDGKFFFSASWDITLKQWNIEDRSLVETVDLTCDRLHRLAVTPDGQNLLSISRDGTIAIWTFPGLKVLTVLSGHVGFGQGIDITQDGKTIVSCGEDRTVRLWSFEERRLLTVLYGHSQSVKNVKVSADGRFAISASDDSVKVWSLEERREVACYKGPARISFAAFTTDSNCVIIASNDQTVRITPFIVPWESTSEAPMQVTSEMVSVVQTLKEGELLNPLAARTLLSPYNVNSLHISAFYNYAERCKEYLEMRVPFLKGTFGSPLTVSLERRTIKCTDEFLKYLIDLAQRVKGDAEWPTFVCINDDIPALLASSSDLLQSFFSALMQTPSSPPLPQFITPTSSLPIVQFSETRLINLPDFDKCVVGKMGSELVRFCIGLIRWNTAPGSSKSLELLDALQECEDKTVLTSPYATALIEQKWAYFYPVTLLFTIMYTMLLAALVMILFNDWDRFQLAVVFICLNGFFMLYEIAQALASSWTYWVDPWNYLDMFRGLLGFFWGSLVLCDQELACLGADNQRNTRLLLAILCFLRGFTYFRSFRMTRLFVYMTMAVVKEMYSFLIIMAYSVFAFGILISILLGHATLGVSWTAAFSLVLGDFDSSAFGFVEWCVFSCAAITNIIIMLNLLVSILGDAYEKTQMSVRENDLFLMLGLVSEYESLMYWRRNSGTPTIIVSCERAQDAVMSEEWAGLAVQLSTKMEEESAKLTQEFQAQLASSSKQLQEEMAVLQGKTEKKTAALEAKLETIIALLRERS